jgi:predicted DNA-binding transcriptional regulator YafY
MSIQRALAERRVLTIEYRSKDRDDLVYRQVEPLGLVHYADHWHLIAHCRLRRAIRDFRTDRISFLELKNEVFLPHENFSLKEFLETCKENKFQMVYLRFDPSAMDRVRRESECGLIEVTEEKYSVRVTLVTCSLDWLTGWILSFGQSAEVLGPKELRDRVAGEAENLYLRYKPAKEETYNLCNI